MRFVRETGRGRKLSDGSARDLTWARGQVGEAAAELLWPTRCVGCDQPGELLCDECRAALPWVEQRLACPVCGTPYGSLTCTGCGAGLSHGEDSTGGAGTSGAVGGAVPLAPAQPAARLVVAGAAGGTAPPAPAQGPLPVRWETRALVAALGFDGTPSRMVRALKDLHELRLAPVMAAAMLGALEEASAWLAVDGLPRFDAAATDAVCFVPATAEAFARRGFDHMELVSRELAGALGLPLADCLVRSESRDQRALGREGRAANLRGSVRVADDVSGARILLVDDVCTTGASVREAARALLARGAASVTACIFARVW